MYQFGMLHAFEGYVCIYVYVYIYAGSSTKYIMFIVIHFIFFALIFMSDMKRKSWTTSLLYVGIVDIDDLCCTGNCVWLAANGAMTRVIENMER